MATVLNLDTVVKATNMTKAITLDKEANSVKKEISAKMVTSDRPAIINLHKNMVRKCMRTIVVMGSTTIRTSYSITFNNNWIRRSTNKTLTINNTSKPVYHRIRTVCL